MAKTQILLPFKGQNLPYIINENNIFHIENELFVLTDTTKKDNFGQLVCDFKDDNLVHIKSGKILFVFSERKIKVNKLRLKNDTKNYIFELLITYVVSNMDNEKFFNAINKAENINDISEIESIYFSKLDKKKPITQKLGKYKITNNSLLSYNTELINNSDSKYIISEFKKWVKFVNEVALFTGYKAELTNKSGNEYTCKIVHNKGQYKFDLYLSDTMLFDFKQCLGISEIKHEINQNNTDVIECINDNVEPEIEAKNSAIIVSDSIYNTILNNLLINVSILNPIRLIKSDINIEVPDINTPTIDKDYITIEYPKGYIPPPPKKTTKLDNKDIIYYEPIKESTTKLIITASGILVEMPKNFKIDSKMVDNKDVYFDDYYQKKTIIKTGKGNHIVYYHYWLTQTDKRLIQSCIENDFLSMHSKQKQIMRYKNNEFCIHSKDGKKFIKIPSYDLISV